jgi:NAD-dependent deacetylase
MEDEQQNIVILTGAGISQESGLDTFRDKGGIWSKVRIEDVATLEAYQRDPVRVQEFYNTRRKRHVEGDIQPNAAHHALARLEKEWPVRRGGFKGGKVTIVTQNIDNLHAMAGSKNLIHMHGEILKARCGDCGGLSACAGDLGKGEACPDCAEINSLRPHVVWFGEMPLEMERIYGLLENCALFISIGTSGNVYPAAGFVQHAQKNNGEGPHGNKLTHTIELNLEPSEGASFFAEARYGTATEIIPAFVEELLSQERL